MLKFPSKLAPVRIVDGRSGGGCSDYGWIAILDDSNAWPQNPLDIDEQGDVVAQATEVSSHRVQDRELYELDVGHDTGQVPLGTYG